LPAQALISIPAKIDAAEQEKIGICYIYSDVNTIQYITDGPLYCKDNLTDL